MEHPYIDFDGDGHGDSYDTYDDGHSLEHVHHDWHGRVDAIAIDNNRDGIMEAMVVDSNHDGVLDTVLTDETGDGYMDSEHHLPVSHYATENPYVDFDGDGHGDNYYTATDNEGGRQYLHTDGYGHVDAVADDHDHNGLMDQMTVDENHDGQVDHVLRDQTGDGYMDTRDPLVWATAK